MSDKYKYCIFDIAAYILSKHEEDEISHKKLQKLCYYVYAWFVFLYNEDGSEITHRLFQNDFEACVHGPVSKSLYDSLKESNDIFSIKISDIKTTVNDITEKWLISFIDEVLGTYYKYSADELESISYQELPWKNARRGLGVWDGCNRKIDDKLIFTEFAKRVDAFYDVSKE
jgi:uncharacterized phage-associated protein